MLQLPLSLELFYTHHHKALPKTQLGAVIQKTNEAKRQTYSTESKPGIIKSVYLTESLLNDGYTLVYCDEFKFSFSSNKFYRWGSKRRNPYFVDSQPNFEFSAIIAFSVEQTYEVQATSKTINSEIFRNFILRVKECQEGKIAIIVDN